MKSKVLFLMLIAGGSVFAQSRFPVSIGGGYATRYSAPRADYAPNRPQVVDRSRTEFDRGTAGAGYWGESSESQHERAEQHGLYNHQEAEKYTYRGSPELQEHRGQEQGQVRQEQWHERNGDGDAGYGSSHGSAPDGYYRQR